MQVGNKEVNCSIVYNKLMQAAWARIVGGIVVVAIISGLLVYLVHQPPAQSRSTPPPSSPSASAIPSSVPPTKTSVGYVYPLPDYSQRLTIRTFGQYVSAADRAKIPCGAVYVGYHDADDLEVLPGELTKPVPVHAIAAGTVRLAGPVSGYGGLIVIEHNLAGQTVTANYGHIDLATATVKVGDTVAAGQVIANLGGQCAASSGGERKHLHFALHLGSAVDVRGYVSRQADLTVWLNPQTELEKIQAVSP